MYESTWDTQTPTSNSYAWSSGRGRSRGKGQVRKDLVYICPGISTLSRVSAAQILTVSEEKIVLRL